jgi:16S rRNA (uracil1498-N3)-methyltransferase
LKEERKGQKRRKRRKKGNPPAMDRIILNEKIDIGKELQIKGPPLEALCFQGGRVGSLVTVTDSGGKDFRGRVLRLSQAGASIFIFDAFPSPTEPSLEIILLQALPEKERMELIIQKATELGVSAIIPFQSERSISLKEREAKQKKSHRWQHIAVKAVQQSRRARVPWVGECRSYREVLEDCRGEGLKILLWEREGENLRDVLRTYSVLNPPL